MSDDNKENKNTYNDELQESIEILKQTASRIEEDYPPAKFEVKDIVLDVIFFFLAVGAAFGWMLLMLMIVSFVTLSYLHFDVKVMLIISAIFATFVAVYYIVKKVKKYL